NDYVGSGQTSNRGNSLPFVVRLLKWFPVLRQLPARFVGLGPRPEHFRSPTAVLASKLSNCLIDFMIYASDVKNKTGSMMAFATEIPFLLQNLWLHDSETHSNSFT